MDYKLFYLGLLCFILSFFVSGLFEFLILCLGLVFFSLFSSHITEELSKHYSKTIGGLINATLGNMGELIIGIFALKQGLVDIVKASISGSIIGNLLFLFGFCVFIGGFLFKNQKINKRLSDVNSTLLMITIILILFPSLLPVFHEEKYINEISLIIAIFMLLIYFSSILFSFVTHKDWFLKRSEGKPKISKYLAWILIFLSILFMSLLGEKFVGIIEELAYSFNLNDLFIGAIIVGVIGNVGEHIGSLHFAIKDELDTVVSISIGSALQISLFVLPVLVILSHFFGTPLNLNFLPIESVSIFVSALLLNEIIRDSEVNWFEGLLLVALYLVIALVFFFYT